MSNEIEYRSSHKDAMQVNFRLNADAGSGTFDGYLNYWHRKDSYKTAWNERAWSRAGLEAAYPLQDMHSVESYTRDTLGMFVAIEDEQGLMVQRGSFAPTAAGQDARALAHLAHEYGQPAGLSVGFLRMLTADKDDEVRSDDPDLFTVTALKESSLIIPHFASQPGAGLTSVRMQAEALRAVADSDDLLDPRTEGRIIDMMTEANGRKRALVIRVGWEAADAAPEADIEATEETPANTVDLIAATEEEAFEDDNDAAEPEDSEERLEALKKRLLVSRVKNVTVR